MNSKKLKPKHHLGQNFLQDDEVLNKIVEAGELKSTDIVLEVGPGLGVLTRELLKHVKAVIAVEKDERLFNLLRDQIGSLSHSRESGNLTKIPDQVGDGKKLTLINEDILSFHVEKHLQGDYKVVANIPYYLTSKLLRNFLELKNPPKLMVLMVQKEVGERIIAKPGELSLLGISAQIYSDPEIVSYVPKESFWPVPKVDSVILKITPKNKYPEIQDKKLFFSILKRAFAGKRKQIHNTLKNDEALHEAGIDPKTRPQDVTIEQWIELYKHSG